MNMYWFLESLCKGGFMKKEVEIINRFIRSGKMHGWFIGEVPAGLEALRSTSHRKYYSEDEIRMIEGVYSKKIDLICVVGVEANPIRIDLKHWLWLRDEKLKGKAVYLFEAKQKLSAEALGQILIYDYLFRDDNPDIKVMGLGIICEETDEIIEKVCRKYNVNVFIVK